MLGSSSWYSIMGGYICTFSLSFSFQSSKYIYSSSSGCCQTKMEWRNEKLLEQYEIFWIFGLFKAKDNLRVMLSLIIWKLSLRFIYRLNMFKLVSYFLSQCKTICQIIILGILLKASLCILWGRLWLSF